MIVIINTIDISITIIELIEIMLPLSKSFPGVI